MLILGYLSMPTSGFGATVKEAEGKEQFTMPVINTLTRKRLNSIIRLRIEDIRRLDQDCVSGLISQATHDATVAWVQGRIRAARLIRTSLQD